MEVIILILLFVVLIAVLTMKNHISSRLDAQDERFESLSRQLANLHTSKQEDKRTAAKPEPPVSAIVVQASAPAVTAEVKKEKPAEIPKVEILTQVNNIVEPVVEKTPPAEPVNWVQEEEKPGFFERNPDLEKFIGENLANKIGIAILVVGIGFFVKYAIDKEWINEIGRVMIGVACGGMLLGVAHWLRKTFSAFSSVLVGGGMAVLYFTIAIAFHEYHIFSQTVAFALMVIITGFTVVLSLGYDRVELAVFAILGGLGSPFMVSTGAGNYVVLFVYMLILNGGMLVLAYHKKWRIINILCYAFTIVIFGGWLTTSFKPQDAAMMRGGLLFATLFYIVFFLMNIVNNLRERTTFQIAEILILLSNTFLYFSAGMYLLNNNAGNEFKGLFTAMLGIFNFVFAFLLYKNERADRNLVYMLIGLVLTFISLAAPIQLQGNYITLFWSAEAVLLLWLSQKSGIRLMEVASVIVMLLMGISLVMDWNQIYFESNEIHLRILLNKGYITGSVSVCSLALTYVLLRRSTLSYTVWTDAYKIILPLAGCVVIYLVNLFELSHQLAYYVDFASARALIIGVYNMLFILVLLISSARWNVPEEIKESSPALGVLAILGYLFYYHGIVVHARNEWLTGTQNALGFFFHYILIVLLITISLISLKRLRTLPEITASIWNLHWWFFVFFFVFVASVELDHTVLMAGYNEEHGIDLLIDENHKIGFPILWGITSFLLIAIGLKQKVKELRIISLALFLVTLLKLFVVDLRDISEGGKIASFISLGILLLVVSFMYQRLKKILLEDSQENAGT